MKKQTAPSQSSGTEQLFRNVLCPIDFSRISIPAIELALRLAVQNKGTIFLLCVIPAGDADSPKADLEHAATNQLRAIGLKWFEGVIAFETVVRTGEPAAAIVEAETQLNIHATVMATHGRSGVDYALLGSVTEQVVRRSTRPVITVNPQ
ncbi:MAG TPA: universal stress protein [Candidatus Binataceae bacterium]|nr:universal stress protein [Candidatus Binataceae bacterium]